MAGWRGYLVVMWGLECKRRELELGLCKKRRGQDSNNSGNSGNSGSESFCLGRQSLLKHDGLAVIGWCVYDMRSIDHAVGEASRVRLASVSLTGGDCLLACSGPSCTVRQSLTCSVRDGHGIPPPRGEGNTEWGQMAISRLDGAASGWWMSCLCRCQASLWALGGRETPCNSHTGLCSPFTWLPLTPLTEEVGSCSSWAKLAERRLQTNTRSSCASVTCMLHAVHACSEHCHTATLPQSVTAHR